MYSNIKYWVNYIEDATAVEKTKLLNRLIENKEHDALLYLLEYKIIDASSKVNFKDESIPMFSRALRLNDVKACEILSKYGANLDYNEFCNYCGHPYEKAHLPLQSLVILKISNLSRYMEKNVLGYQELLIDAIKNGNATPTILDSYNMTPISLLFSTLKFPENYYDGSNFVKMILDLVDMYIHNGLDINKRDKYGKSSLYYLINKNLFKKETSELLEYLLERGATIDGIEDSHIFQNDIHPINLLDMFKMEKTAILLINAGINLLGVDKEIIKNDEIIKLITMNLR